MESTLHFFTFPDHSTFNEKLMQDIEFRGDEMFQKTNLKCIMTSHTMHHLSDNFALLANFAIEQGEKLLGEKLYIETLWGAVYHYGDFALCHNHASGGCKIAFCYFVDMPSGCSPLIFPNAQKPWLPPRFAITPEAGTIVMWPSDFDHYVPPHPIHQKRVVIAGNLTIEEQEVIIYDSKRKTT
ncbi:MAG: hypothetical protein EAY65_07235 [Alphaproteobacteria bacterium]|nr:MAG: hypothetical protein EAY65_07235 [Alphaproteobacteria bacterium]